MSLIKEILRVISNYPGGYSTIYELIYNESPRAGKHTSKQVVSNVLSRLKKKGLISKEKETWKITRLGKEMLMHKNNALLSFIPEKPNKKQKKTTIIVFDIPEKKRKYRDWLRYELIGLGFEFVQQSVWFGPTLPQEFVVYLEKVKLIKYTRFFKVKEGDLI